MTRSSPDPVAESAALLDALSYMFATRFPLDRYIAKLHQKVLLQQVVTDDKATHTLARIGEDVLHGMICLRLGQLHPYQTQEWYSTAQHALCASLMRTFFFCKAGIFRGPVKRGTTSIANLFNIFIGAFWIQHGFEDSLTMITDIYQDSFAAASDALFSHEQEHGPLSSASTAGQAPASGSNLGPIKSAVIRVIYGLHPSLSERFALSSVETPPGDNGHMTALGTEFLPILTATAIRQEYPDISVDILQTLFEVIFDPQILDHIAHRLVGGRTPSQGGRGLLYLWLGHLVKAKNEILLEDFVRSVTVPMFAAARAIRYPFYHPRARLSKDPSLSTDISAAMQQLLVYWSEMSYLEFYQAPVDDTTLFANIPDLSDFVRGTWPMEDLEASVQAYEALMAEQTDDHAPGRSGTQQDFTHIIARGFDVANTKQRIRLATAFAKELPIEAEFLRLLAAEGKPNGGAIFRIRVTDKRTLFHGGDEAADPFEFEGLQIFLSTETSVLKARFARRVRDVDELHKQMCSLVKRATFTTRDIDYYRTILTEPYDPLLLRPMGLRHLDLFGRKMMVFRRDVDNRGYVKDTSIPSIPRCGVQFRPRRGGLPSCEPKLLFEEGDRPSVRDYDLSLDKGVLKIICSVTLPQSFVDNLNAVRPQMRGVQGTWLFIPQAELSIHMLRIANRKASMIRLSS